MIDNALTQLKNAMPEAKLGVTMITAGVFFTLGWLAGWVSNSLLSSGKNDPTQEKQL